MENDVTYMPVSTRPKSAREEANFRLAIDVYEHVLKPLDSTRVDEFFASNYIQHNPMAESGAQGLKDFLDWARRESPEARHHVKRILVDGDFVVGHVHVVIKPGDRGNMVIDIFRMQDGRVAEHWDASQAIEANSRNGNGPF